MAGSGPACTLSPPGMAPKEMSRELSTFLDILRFTGAILVLLYHINSETFGPWLWQLRAFGQQGVVIFFVMSGYVIAYTTDKKNTSLREYTIARAARLYSVVIPALILTIAVDTIVRYAGSVPNIIHDEWGSSWSALTKTVFYNVTFTSQLWFLDQRFRTNIPFWSLSYEVWYYVIFAAAFYYRGMTRTFLVLLTSAIAGPRILMLFPLWLFGVFAYRVGRRVTVSPIFAWPLFFVSGFAALYFLVNNTDDIFLREAQYLFGGDLVWILLRPGNHFYYLLGAAVALNILTFKFIETYFSRIERVIGGGIRYAAGATFSIYLFHFPIIDFFTVMFLHRTPSPIRSFLLYMALFTALFLLARVTERRKVVWTRLFAKLLYRRLVLKPGGEV